MVNYKITKDLVYLFLRIYRAGKIAQSVKDLSHRHKNLCLVPRTQYKMIGMKIGMCLKFQLWKDRYRDPLRLMDQLV